MTGGIETLLCKEIENRERVRLTEENKTLCDNTCNYFFFCFPVGARGGPTPSKYTGLTTLQVCNMLCDVCSRAVRLLTS